MIIPAKQRLQQSQNAKEIAALLSSQQFEMASEAAMLTFVNNLPEAQDAQSAMAYHAQLNGAKRFLSTLANIMVPAPERAAYVPGTLKPVP